ncbi:MAG: tyrosine phosphatase family protein [Alphaproteobacteria bacterium]|jgi:predicted protein tyrosine phosphatase|tara:strand:- start:26372 stop:26878 length:507 start_codon:yes stop_codon:yes gene_type:complete
MKIVISPLSLANKMIDKYNANYIISILSPGESFPIFEGIKDTNHLKLSFNDITSPRKNLIQPSLGHVKNIISFTKKCTKNDTLLIHCYAGISRSTAAALIVYCYYKKDLRADLMATELMSLSPSANPNSLLLKLGDHIIGSSNILSECHKILKKPILTYENKPFTLNC